MWMLVYKPHEYYSDIYHKPELIQPLFLGNCSRYGGPILCWLMIQDVDDQNPTGAKGCQG